MDSFGQRDRTEFYGLAERIFHSLSSPPLKAPPGFDPDGELRDLVRHGLFGATALRMLGGHMPKAHPNDPEFEEASNFTRKYRGFHEDLAVERLKPLAQAFQANIDRVRAMATTLVVVAFWADQIARIECLARYSIGSAPDDRTKDGTPAMFEALQTSLDEFVARRAKLGHAGADNDTWTKGIRALEPSVGVAFEQSKLREESDYPVARGIDSIFGSMVSLAYAAYEALAIDLWVEAVNADGALAKAWFAAKANQNKNKSYPISDLLDNDFNLTGKIGAWMKDKDVVTFTSSAQIQAAYEAAFGYKAKACFDVGLHVTEQVRHSLAHRGGVTESRFLKAVQTHPIYGKLTIGERLPLDGALVRHHVDSCINTIVDLLAFVDRHLTAKGAQ